MLVLPKRFDILIENKGSLVPFFEEYHCETSHFSDYRLCLKGHFGGRGK